MKEIITKNKYKFLILIYLLAVMLLFCSDFTTAKYSETVDVGTIYLDFSENAETTDSEAPSETEPVSVTESAPYNIGT